MIRPRTAADLDACVLALRAVHEVDAYPLNWPRDPVAWLTEPGLLAAWVDAPAETEIAGHVLVTSAGVVSRLFVAPAHRGRGIGARLLTEIRQWAATRRLDLHLDVIDRGHSAAITLYESTGWIYERTEDVDWKDPSGAPVKVRIYSLPSPA